MFQWPVEFAEMAASLLFRGRRRETGMMPGAQRGADSPASSNMSVYQVRAADSGSDALDSRPGSPTRAVLGRDEMIIFASWAEESQRR